MRCVCPIHGSSLHCKVCRHVAQVCKIPDLPLPLLGESIAKDAVCRDCMTPEVVQLLQVYGAGMDDYDGAVRWFDCFEQLRQKIGYTPMCTECLYEKTGIDRRRNSSSMA